MKVAWVTTNLLDMREKPDHSSERVNQALFGEPVRILGEKAGFYRLQKQDGYIGWSDSRMVQTVSERVLKQYRSRLNRIVTTASTAIYASDRNNKISPYFCFYGTQVAMTKKRGRMAVIALPDGSTPRMASSSLRRIVTSAVKGRELVVEARKFLGVPYLWGGLSPAGYDCSGLMQMICARFGISIPRDTKEQRKVGKNVDREKIKTGDLLFFDRHVGLAIGGGKIIHCSLGGGGVRVNSLSPDSVAYREDLDKSFSEARRIL